MFIQNFTHNDYWGLLRLLPQKLQSNRQKFISYKNKSLSEPGHVSLPAELLGLLSLLAELHGLSAEPHGLPSLSAELHGLLSDCGSAWPPPCLPVLLRCGLPADSEDPSSSFLSQKPTSTLSFWCLFRTCPRLG